MFTLRPDHYILIGKSPVAIDPDDPGGLVRWGKWFETADRHVGDETVCGKRVSTVFLGLDHNFTREGPPVLFETMVFEAVDEEDQIRSIEMPDGTIKTFRHEMEEVEDYTERYCTWEDAEAGHKMTVEMVRRLAIKIVNGNA